MAHKERINPKTKQKEYKARYYFMRDGKRRDSETAWFPTLAQAEKEAKELKKAKEMEDRHKAVARREKTILTIYEEFLESLKASVEELPSNTVKGTIRSANSIYKKYFPKDVQNVKIRDANSYTFKKWMAAINDGDLAGSSVRNYRKVLIKFNQYLSLNGYYLEDGMEEQVEYTLNKAKLKPSAVGNRELEGNRHVITLLDFMQITYYYYDKGLDNFRDFYYYTMWYLFFFSGMRKEEVIGLQWKFIDLREEKRVIHVKNAIAHVESEEDALERVSKELYKTKNLTSIRNIPIFDFYYELLIDYKESYMCEFNLREEELEECFVFPRMKKGGKAIPQIFANADTVYRELQAVCKARGIKKTDVQMFRHSCATFLILPPPNGLGYTEERVKDFFGHSDTTMLTKIYARLDMLQKEERMRDTFGDIFNPEEDKSKIDEKVAKEKLIARIKGDNETAKIARKLRVFAQIEKVYKLGRREYFYLPKDEWIIQEYKEGLGFNKKDLVFTLH